MLRKLSYLFLFIGIFLNSQVLAQPELDLTFGGTGGFTVPSPNSGSTADLAIQPDGKILTLGPCFNINAPFLHTFCITRMNENGSIDNTFGTSFQPGYVLTRVPGADSNMANPSTGIAVQSDNKILAVGYASVSGFTHPVFARYSENGALDTDFGVDGIMVSPLLGKAFELVILPDDKFLIVGTDESSNSNLMVARFTSDGILDTSFGNNGIASLNIPGTTSLGLSIEIQPDGKILTGGYLFNGAGTKYTSFYLLTRLNQDGSLDTTFDNDGYRTIGFNLPTIVARTQGFLSIALQSDGRILALGSTNILYRFNSDGSIDTGFGVDGSRQALNASDGTTDPYDLVVTASGKSTVVGYRYIPGTTRFPNFTPKYRVARYLPNGSPDISFSDDGFLDFSPQGPFASGATSAIIDLRGRVMIGGLSGSQILFGGWQTPSFSIARLIASPIQNVEFTGRVVSPNGKPIVNAVLKLQSGTETIKIGRTNPFGYFHFPDVQSGQTYTISTNTKGLNFNDRSVLVDDTITSFIITSN